MFEAIEDVDDYLERNSRLDGMEKSFTAAQPQIQFTFVFLFFILLSPFIFLIS